MKKTTTRTVKTALGQRVPIGSDSREEKLGDGLTREESYIVTVSVRVIAPDGEEVSEVLTRLLGDADICVALDVEETETRRVLLDGNVLPTRE